MNTVLKAMFHSQVVNISGRRANYYYYFFFVVVVFVRVCVYAMQRVKLLVPEVNARGGWSLSECHSFLLVPSFGRCLLSFACRLTKNGSMYTHAHTHAHARGALSACFTKRGSAIVKKQ